MWTGVTLVGLTSWAEVLEWEHLVGAWVPLPGTLALCGGCFLWPRQGLQHAGRAVKVFGLQAYSRSGSPLYADLDLLDVRVA